MDKAKDRDHLYRILLVQFDLDWGQNNIDDYELYLYVYRLLMIVKH